MRENALPRGKKSWVSGGGTAHEGKNTKGSSEEHGKDVVGAL